tara:strand:+ start:1027 stop:1287 length:261 start_codon:yes stop_codon:yes gene_type:complete
MLLQSGILDRLHVSRKRLPWINPVFEFRDRQEMGWPQSFSSSGGHRGFKSHRVLLHVKRLVFILREGYLGSPIELMLGVLLLSFCQ